MSFAAAAWLWSGLALAAPIIIHLLGRGRGTPLRWPSVVLLRQAALASGRRFRPSQPWLLLLRCLLLAAVTLALAEPSLPHSDLVGVIVLAEPGVEVSPSTVSSPGPGASRTAGELPARVVETRLLEVGLPLASGGSAAETARDQGRTPGVRRGGGSRVSTDRRVDSLDPAGRVGDGAALPAAAADLWSLLAEADATLPAGPSFVVVATPRLAGLRGARPHLGRPVTWLVPGRPLDSAVQPSDITGKRFDGIEKRHYGAGQRLGEMPAPTAEAPMRPTLPGAAGANPAAAPRLRIWIEATAERAADAAALRTGLARGAAALGWALEEAPSAGWADILASLGREAPASWGPEGAPAAVVLRDADQVSACSSLVDTGTGTLFLRTLCGEEPAGMPLWRDGAGRAVLSVQGSAAAGSLGSDLAGKRPSIAATAGSSGSIAGAVILRYAGRFTPTASDLSRGAYAALLRVAGDRTATAQLERAGDGAAVAAGSPGSTSEPAAAGGRRLLAVSSAPARGVAVTSVAQALPGRATVPAGAAVRTSLAPWLWLLAACLFAAERWLAGRGEKRRAGVPAVVDETAETAPAASLSAPAA